MWKQIKMSIKNFIVCIIFSTLPIITYASSISMRCSDDISMIPEGRQDLLCKQPVQDNSVDITEERAIEIAREALILNGVVRQWLADSKVEAILKDSPGDRSYWDVTFYDVTHKNILDLITVTISNKGHVRKIAEW